MSRDGVFSTTLRLTDEIGWHLRPASLLAKIAHMFDADIMAERGRRSASAKSLFGIIMLCASGGRHLRVTARGHDAMDAIKAIEAGFSTSVQDAAKGVGVPPPQEQGCGMTPPNIRNKRLKAAGRTIRKTVMKLAGRGKSTAKFVCAATPGAGKVSVVGDFNGWDPHAGAMTRRDGHFVKSIKLTPGEHQYKFIIDGEWHVDPSAPTVVSELGTLNNVISGR